MLAGGRFFLSFFSLLVGEGGLTYGENVGYAEDADDDARGDD